MYKVADDEYNKYPTYSYSTPVYTAVPGMDLPTSRTVTKGGTYIPLKVNYSNYQNLDPSMRTVEYTEETNLNVRTSGGGVASDYAAYLFTLFNTVYNFDNRDSATVLVDTFFNYATYKGNQTKVAIRTTNRLLVSSSGLPNVGFADVVGQDNNSSKVYRRKTPDDDKVKIEVINDQIKVTTDRNYVGYAVPASCNVDIVLGIPVNGAANNINNLDGNSSPTAGSPYTYSGDNKMPTADGKSTPISQIGRTFHDFVKKFHYTRGVNVGIVPYCGMVSLPLNRVETWAVDPENFDRTVFPGNQNTYQGYIRPCMFYGLVGDVYRDLSQFKSHYGINTNSFTNVMVPQGRIEAVERYGNNLIYCGDILSTNDPAGDVEEKEGYLYSPKFMRRPVHTIPGFAGKFNFLSMSFDSSKVEWHYCNPYHIVEMQSDLLKITDLLNLFYPFNFASNGLSNFIFVPFVWANNLFQDWSNDPKYDPEDTTDAKLSTMTNETSGRLSTPSKTTEGRKKALILVVNKPDWFEPGELTYLGYDNDFSEIPMIESDCIRGDINYGDTTKYFADGTKYDGTVQGAKKILKLTGFTRNSTTGYYECASGTATLTFPQKYLVKLVVEPLLQSTKLGSASANIYNSDGHGGSFYDSVCYGEGKLYFARNNSYYHPHFGYYDIATNTWAAMPARYTGDVSGNKETYWVSLCYHNGMLYVNHYHKGGSSGGEIWAYDTAADTFIFYVLPESGSKWSTLVYNDIMYFCGYKAYLGSYDGTSLDLTSRYIGNGSNTDQSFGGTNRSLCAWNDRIYFISNFTTGEIKYWDLYTKSLGTFATKMNSVCSESQCCYSICILNGIMYAVSAKSGAIYRCDLEGKKWEQVTMSANTAYSLNEDWQSICTDGNNTLFATSFTYGNCISYKLKSGSITFTNITSTTNQGTSANKEYSVADKKEFYIEPNQISDTQTDGNYTITFNSTNLRLISAEITNRPYEKTNAHTVPTESDSNHSLKTTYVTVSTKRPLKVRFRKYTHMACALSPVNSSTMPKIKEATSSGKSGSISLKSGNAAINVHHNRQSTITYNNDCFSNCTAVRKANISLKRGYISGLTLENQKVRFWFGSDNYNTYTTCRDSKDGVYWGYPGNPDKQNKCFWACDECCSVTDMNGIHESSWCWSMNTMSKEGTDPYIVMKLPPSIGTADIIAGGISSMEVNRVSADPQYFSGNNLVQVYGQIKNEQDSSWGNAETLFTANPLSEGTGLVNTTALNYTGNSNCEYVKIYEDRASANDWWSLDKIVFSASGTGTEKNNVVRFENADGTDIAGLQNSGSYSGYISFVGTGDLTIQISPIQAMIEAENLNRTGWDRSPDHLSEQNWAEFTIDPKKHYYEPYEGGYRIKIRYRGRITDHSDNNIQAIKFTKIRLPENSRVVDFSQNVNGKPAYDSNLIIYGDTISGDLNRLGIVWDSDRNSWVSHSIIGEGLDVNGVCGWNHHYYQQVRGNFYCLLDDVGSFSPKFLLVKNPNPKGSWYEASHKAPGLVRRWLSLDEQEDKYTRFDIYDINRGAKYQYIITGLTLPINAALWAGASGDTLHSYQWQSDKNESEEWVWNNFDATEAVKEVTKSACAKLKTDYENNLRVYLIKFRKQTQYKHKVTGATTNFDYSYLDSCATGTSSPYMYDITTEADLKSALDAIYTNISSWATRTEAKNV